MPHDLHLEDIVDHDDFVCKQLQREKRKSVAVFYGPEKPDGMSSKQPSAPPCWRMKEKYRTVQLGLILCLNIGVDPPDVIKRKPSATLQCWIEPNEGVIFSATKPVEKIANQLKAQYDRWQSKAKYKMCLDATSDDVKRMAVSLRRTARDERILLHYNGHGCPRPTSSGEIWVFNKNFTQYIPLSLGELHSWAGSPTIYVFDCPAAGEVINALAQIRIQNAGDGEGQEGWTNSRGAKDDIIFAACKANQTLPQKPQLPADIFTSCLTTPIKMALVWYQLENKQTQRLDVPVNIADILDGQLNDKKTPIGEINWIFTAITDTIAWIELPRDTFQRLFRQDMLLSSLFRNFLLADRIMSRLNCNPKSYPELPSMAKHYMWDVWDLALDRCVSQVIKIQNGQQKEYKPSTFFMDQLASFELWLTTAGPNSPPPHLPIVQQVLLSPNHRLRALSLLACFLDLGDRYIDMALAVGIFPYISKLLQSSQQELRGILIFIWVKILALHRIPAAGDPAKVVDNVGYCVVDLLKEDNHRFFLEILRSSPESPTSAALPVTPSVASEPGSPTLEPEIYLPSLRTWSTPEAQKTLAAVVISILCETPPLPVPRLNEAPTQSVPVSPQQLCRDADGLKLCVDALDSSSPLLRRWLCLCIGKLIEGSEDGIAQALALSAHEKMYQLLHDRSVYVRAAAVISLASFLQVADPFGDDSELQKLNTNVDIVQQLLMSRSDASPLVRCELVHALVILVLRHRGYLRQINASVLSAFIQGEEAKYNLSPSMEMNRSLPGSFEQRFPGESPHLFAAAEVMLTQADFSQDCDPETLHVHLQVVRSIVLLANDPVPTVWKAAAQLLKGVKELCQDDETRYTPVSAAALPPSDSLPNLRLARSPYKKKRSMTLEDGQDSMEVAELTVTSSSRDPDKDTPPSGPIPPAAQLKKASFPRLPNSTFTQSVDSDEEDTEQPRGKWSLTDGRPTSDFFERNVNYFVTSLLRCTPSQDISGRHQLSSQWKISRNERQIVDALVDGRWKDVENKRIDDNAWGLLSDVDSSSGVRNVMFHPFNPLLISSDNYDGVYVWNLEDLRAINAFRATIRSDDLYSPLSRSDPSFSIKEVIGTMANPNKEPRPVITGMTLINPHNYSLLLVATNAGCVHIFRDYVTQGRTSTVSGFRVVQSDCLWKKWHCIVDWNQISGLLSVSSQCNVVTVWDLSLERCALDLRTGLLCILNPWVHPVDPAPEVLECIRQEIPMQTKTHKHKNESSDKIKNFKTFLRPFP
eukprot:EG_transcript_346